MLSEARLLALRQGVEQAARLFLNRALTAALHARALRQHAHAVDGGSGPSAAAVARVDLAPLAAQVANDVCALTLEKHGVTPEVEVQRLEGERGAAEVCGQAASVAYALTEVVKNAVGVCCSGTGWDGGWDRVKGAAGPGRRRRQARPCSPLLVHHKHMCFLGELMRDARLFPRPARWPAPAAPGPYEPGGAAFPPIDADSRLTRPFPRPSLC